jgi:hypothetical protein
MNLNRDKLKKLMEKHEGPCVSIFMPMHRFGDETRQNPIRFKNLLREAEEELISGGLRAPGAREFLEPVQGLLQGDLFHHHQGDGLAVFLSAELFHLYLLPLSFEELVIVADRFHIRPLLPLFSEDGRYYVLALSQNRVRLLQGSHYNVNEVDLSDVPKNLGETLRDDDSWKELRILQSITSGGESKLVRHGEEVDNKENIQRYFRQIDKGLHDLFKDQQAPLVLAAVDYLHPIYREVNTYPQLIREGVSGNPEHLSAKELHEQAWAIVRPYFLKNQQKAVDRCKEFIGSGRVSNRITKIIPAAYQGRVELLFVVADLHQWGTFDPSTEAIHLHRKEKSGDEDLLEVATIQTLLNRGAVYVVKSEDIPDAGALSAVFRY